MTFLSFDVSCSGTQFNCRDYWHYQRALSLIPKNKKAICLTGLGPSPSWYSLCQLIMLCRRHFIFLILNTFSMYLNRLTYIRFSKHLKFLNRINFCGNQHIFLNPDFIFITIKLFISLFVICLLLVLCCLTNFVYLGYKNIVTSLMLIFFYFIIRTSFFISV